MMATLTAPRTRPTTPPRPATMQCQGCLRSRPWAEFVRTAGGLWCRSCTALLCVARDLEQGARRRVPEGVVRLHPELLPACNRLLRATATAYEVSPRLLRRPGPGRQAALLAEARGVLCYLLTVDLGLNRSAIARYLGCNRRSVGGALVRTTQEIGTATRSVYGCGKTVAHLAATISLTAGTGPLRRVS